MKPGEEEALFVIEGIWHMAEKVGNFQAAWQQ
jgi:hypothetical protein